MKSFYIQMCIERLAILPGASVLAGSVTSTKMKVNTVEVDEFDAGFSIGPEGNDFQDITFD